MLRIYVSIDKLNCPSPTSRVRWHQGPPASPCVKFRRFPRSTIPDNSAMCLNTQNRCIRREENAVCILGLDCTDWFHGSASTIHDCVSPCFTHFACCTALLCSRKRNAKSAYAFFFPIGIGKDCADRKRNVESALAFSPTRIEKRG